MGRPRKIWRKQFHSLGEGIFCSILVMEETQEEEEEITVG
jgi:hypothetical protein